jgi:hypothetical protein
MNGKNLISDTAGDAFPWRAGTIAIGIKFFRRECEGCHLNTVENGQHYCVFKNHKKKLIKSSMVPLACQLLKEVKKGE